MKYCSNCGSQIPETATFCTNCGNKLGDQNDNTNQNNDKSETINQNYGGKPNIIKRDIVVAIILSMVTCGIYGIIWFINMVNDVNTVCADDKSNQSGGVVFLLTLVTCGIYGIIWFYQVGKRMSDAGRKYGMDIADNSTIYLVLQLFGLGIVNYCLIQSDLNRFSL